MIGSRSQLAAVLITLSTAAFADGELVVGECTGYDEVFEHRLSLLLTDAVQINECGGARWTISKCGTSQRMTVHFDGDYYGEVEAAIISLRDGLRANSESTSLQQVKQAIVGAGWVPEVTRWPYGNIDCARLCNSASQEGCAL